MIFSAFDFVFIFLPIVFAGFFMVSHAAGRDAAIVWMIGGSFLFYGWGIHAHILIFILSIAGNFIFGRAIRRIQAANNDGAAKTLAATGVILNLALLGYFKYIDFFRETLNALLGTSFVLTHLVLPLAISFFTLQQIAYLIDTYRGVATEYRFINYVLFVSFFPHLIAGPIVHHAEIMPQFEKKRVFRFHPGLVAQGLTIFFLGLFKKVGIADNLAPFSDAFFAAVHSGATPSLLESWIGALAFGLVIYFDFSAYSDMAIGLARIIGIRFPDNFNAPYQATNIIDFWRRWHMTLSRFLRDYVYIPLGGSRLGETRRTVNLMATMLIGGLWHGASWTFVVWGGLHGLYLSINHAWNRAKLGGIGPWPGRLLTFLAVTVAWVFFRAQTFTDAWTILGGMAGVHGVLLPAQILQAIPVLATIASPSAGLPLIANGTLIGLMQCAGFTAFGLALAFFGRPIKRLTRRQRFWLLALTFAFSIQAVLVGGNATAFVYFRF